MTGNALKMLSMVAASLLAALAAADSAAAAGITGAGASFPAPAYSKWADAYQKATGVRVNYQSIGSGGGITQITAKTVDFGASDMPLKPADLDKEGLLQFPTLIGGVVPVVNVAGVKSGELRLTGALLADIFLGKVRKWNDAPIRALNPKLSLPNRDIAVVRRADGSGTTYIFTNYLSKVSAQWKSSVGEGTAVQWPTGLGGKGNEGVAAFVQRIPAAIGYVEYAYARQSKLAYVLMQNAEGQFVAPDQQSFKAAAAGADWTKSAFNVILTHQPGKDSWPITGATFILMHRKQETPRQALEVLKFFDWAYANGDRMAAELEYVPLPGKLVTLVRSAWTANIRDGAGNAIWGRR